MVSSEHIRHYDGPNPIDLVEELAANNSWDFDRLNDDQIVTRAIFKYKLGSKDQIQEKVLNIKKQRLLSQPIKNKTSGSTFKNPTNHFAAKLIEQSDCKGLKVGDAFVSLQHSNFIINKGSATASDIENLGKLIIEKVNNKFDIMLDWEIKIIGEK